MKITLEFSIDEEFYEEYEYYLEQFLANIDEFSTDIEVTEV